MTIQAVARPAAIAAPLDESARWLPVAETKRPHTDPPIRRLIVLVPNTEIDPLAWATRIKTLASPRNLAVLLVGRTQDDQELWDLRRGLTTLAALIATPPEIVVETRVSTRRAWVDVVAEVMATGDLVVCHREQRIGARWPWQQRSLADAIRLRLRVPVCTLTGFALSADRTASSLINRVMAWGTPLGVIAAMGLVQVEIQTHTTGLATTALLSLSMLVELVVLGLLSQN